MINLQHKDLFPLMAAILLSYVVVTEASALSYPPTPEKVVTDVYHDIKVSDPYRWMESKDNPEFTSWLNKQGEFARHTLRDIPGRESLEKRVLELAGESLSIRNLEVNDSRLFFLQREPGESDYKLAMMEQGSSNRVVLVDPADFRNEQSPTAIDWFKGSPNGNLIVLGISKGGSEDSTLRIFDIKSGKFLEESIDRTSMNGFYTIKWLGDNKRFFYNRSPKGERYNNTRIHLHMLGHNPEQDPPLWGAGVNQGIQIDPSDASYLRIQPGSEHVVAVVTPGVGRDRRFYSSRLTDLVTGKAKWNELADKNDRWFRGYLHNESLYVLSNQAAPRYKLLKVDLEHPERPPELLIPPGEAVLEDVAVAKDALYVQALVGGVDKLIRVSYGSKNYKWVDLPFDGRIRDLKGDIRREGVVFKMEGWTQSPRIYALSSRGLEDTKIVAESSIDFSPFSVTRAEAISHDGIRVPLTIIHRNDIRLDGHNPTILTGYGAYGFAFKPGFDAKLMAWLERGGVYAIAHIRGGGEFGESWHKDGKILTKSNTILDFIACAEYLVDKKYTQPEKLAGMGRSAGGITIGGAITERPDLFIAANHAVGVADLLRSELTATGPANVPEYGTVKNRYQFLAMHSTSPYHRVKNDVDYPATIVTTGINDPRVPSWQPGKFAARLQNASSSNRPIILRVDNDAGHGMGSNLQQRAKETADVWSFFLWQMGEPDFQ